MEILNKIIDKAGANSTSRFWLFFFLLLFLSLFMMNKYVMFEFNTTSHDFYFHFKRFTVLTEAIRNGSFPVYIDYSSIDGYGYLTRCFYSDFILIPFAIIAIFTTPLFGFQVLIFTSTILCGVFTYITVNTVFKSSFAATVSAILFTFCIYRLLDVFHRFAVGEAVSFTFIPIVFLGLYHIIKGDYRKWYIIAIGYSLMIFTHVLSTVLMFGTMMIILIICYKPLLAERKRIVYLILAGVVTIVITSYYLLPMLEQVFSNTFYYDTNKVIFPWYNRLTTDRLINGLFSGFVYPKDAFLPGIGAILAFGVLIRLFVKEKSVLLRYVDVGVLIGAFYIFATSSYFPWGTFPFNRFAVIQFPWRLLEFTSFFFAVAIGFYLSRLVCSQYRKLVALGVVIALTVVMMVGDSQLYKATNYPMRKVTALNLNKVKDVNPQVGNPYFYFQMGSLEYIPSRFPSPYYVRERGDSVLSKNENTIIRNFYRDKEVTGFDVEIATADSLEIPLFYYKGYTAMLGDKVLPVTESSKGLVQIPVDSSGSIKVYYAGTILQKMGWYITIVAVFALCIYIFVQRRKKII